MDRMGYLLLLLNPASNSFKDRIRGHNSVRWEDVVSAMSMGDLDSYAYYLGLAKYCQDTEAEAKLIRILHQYGGELAVQYGWRSKPEYLQKLSLLACKEFIEGNTCPECDGMKRDIHGDICQVCSGTGLKRLSQRAKYQFADIDKRNWERRWQERYEKLYYKLCEAEGTLLCHLRQQLRD